MAEGGEPGGPGLGLWLVDQACGAGAWEAAWLEALVVFDRARGWAGDGALSCADWLIGRVRLARSTAFEKLRVAHELARRPVVAEALAAGRIGYCAVREITRATGADAAVDEALVDLAAVATVLEVRRAVRAFLLCAEQDRPPQERCRGRGLRMVARGDGTTRVEAVLTDLEAAELAAALDERMGDTDTADVSRYAGDSSGGFGEGGEQSTREDGGVGEGGERVGEGGEQSTREDGGVASLGEWEWRAWHERRADALMDLVAERSARANGADRYLVHVVLNASNVGPLSGGLLGGEPLDAGVLGRVLCDCSNVTHVIGEAGEALWLGRRQRVWSVAQRRAIAVRDKGCCRFPQCERTRADAHHVRSWEDGGATDVDNGILLCPHHHTMVHHGWTVTGDVDGTLVFHRPR